jgi:hypothetical protein
MSSNDALFSRISEQLQASIAHGLSDVQKALSATMKVEVATAVQAAVKKEFVVIKEEVVAIKEEVVAIKEEVVAIKEEVDGMKDSIKKIEGNVTNLMGNVFELSAVQNIPAIMSYRGVNILRGSRRIFEEAKAPEKFMKFNEALLDYKTIWDEQLVGHGVTRAELTIKRKTYQVPKSAVLQVGGITVSKTTKTTVADSAGISMVEIDFIGLVGNGGETFTSPENAAPARPSEIHVSARVTEPPPMTAVIYEISMTSPPGRNSPKIWQFMNKLVQLERNVLFVMKYYDIRVEQVYAGIYMKKDGDLQQDIMAIVTEFKASLPILFELITKERLFIDY